MIDDQRRRCAREWHSCADPEPYLDDEGRTRKAPALTGDEGTAFCPACIRHLGYTLTSLPLDVAELGDRLVPTMAVRYRDPDMPTQQRIKLHAPLPLDVNADALRALIDHELAQWAASTATEAGVDWSEHLAARSRIGHRVTMSCELIRYRLPYFLGLPPVWQRVYSTGEHPLDGWSDDARARMTHPRPGEWWIQRDGTDGALLLFDLHDLVERSVGRASADGLRTACPGCQRRALRREHRFNRVVCRGCWREMSDDEYDALIAVTANVFGVAR